MFEAGECSDEAEKVLHSAVMQPEGSISMELMAGRKRSSTFSRSYEECAPQ